MGEVQEFSVEALTEMKNYVWPGNVPELGSKIRKALVLSGDHLIKPPDLDLSEHEVPAGGLEGPDNGHRRGKIEKQEFIETLELCRHNISRTAKILQVSRPTVYSLKRRFEI